MKVYLCGGGKPCCPSFERLVNGVTIRDDYGGLVVLTNEEFEELKNRIG